MNQTQFDIFTYIEIEKNLNAMGYFFKSVADFFEFIMNRIVALSYGNKFTVYLDFESMENKGLFVCEVNYPT